MKPRNHAAKTVGILFIVATVFFVGGEAIYGPVLAAPDYLERASAERATVVAGVLLGLIGVLAIPLIPAHLLPILRPANEGWALGYLAMRIVEAALLMIVTVNTLSLLDLSRGYLAGSVSAAEAYRIGTTLEATSEWAFTMSVGLVFPVGALILYALLYGQRLVPRWISMWGLVAAALLLAGTALDIGNILAGIPEPWLEVVVTTPIAVNEMVLAVWLIARGFARGVLPAGVTASAGEPSGG